MIQAFKSVHENSVSKLETKAALPFFFFHSCIRFTLKPPSAIGSKSQLMPYSKHMSPMAAPLQLQQV